MLPLRPLGVDGMGISRIGLGTNAIGGADWAAGWGPQDEDESVATIHRAVAVGVNWIDTAPIYGNGRAETVVGRALRGLPPADRPLVFTKCGLRWQEGRPRAEPERWLTPRSIRDELEASLRRLGVERVDLYQVHWPPHEPGGVAAYWGVMDELRREGKVRAIGLSNHPVDLLEAASSVARVDAVQPQLSILHRSDAPQIAWAARHGAGVVVYSPLASGLLTGSFSRARLEALDATDWRRGHPSFGAALDTNLALVDELRPLAARPGTSLAAFAVAWALAWPGVTGAIVGARSPAQLDPCVRAASLDLDPQDVEAVAAALTAGNAGVGPVRPD